MGLDLVGFGESGLRGGVLGKFDFNARGLVEAKGLGDKGFGETDLF